MIENCWNDRFFVPRVTAELLTLQAPMQRQTTFCPRKILHVYPFGCTVDSFSCMTGFFRTLISVIIWLLQEVDPGPSMDVHGSRIIRKDWSKVKQRLLQGEGSVGCCCLSGGGRV